MLSPMNQGTTEKSAVEQILMSVYYAFDCTE